MGRRGRRGRESTKMTIIITHSAFHRVRIDSFILLWVHHRIIIITIALVTGHESMRGGQWDVELTSCMTWMFIQQTANTRLTSDITNRRITSCSDASLHILLAMGEECAISWDLVLVSLYCFFACSSFGNIFLSFHNVPDWRTPAGLVEWWMVQLKSKDNTILCANILSSCLRVLSSWNILYSSYPFVVIYIVTS